MAYNGTIKVIAGLKQANDGDFPIVDSSAVRVDDNTRLNEKLSDIITAISNISGTVDLSGYATISSVNAKYTKPSTGIPKTDLASAVQTSLDKADTALQSHQSLANYATTSSVSAKYTKPSTGIPKTDLASAVQTSLGKADTAIQSLDSCVKTENVATTVSEGNTNPISSGAVFTKLSEYATKNDISSVYKFKGSIGGNDNIGDPYIDTTTGYINFTSWVAYNGAFENGDVYNISEDFTTDSSFKEGAGKKYKAGTNIACIKTITSTTWDVLGGSTTVDLSGYATNESLADVATSGSYNDLTDKPNIPEGAVVDTAMSDTSTNSVQNKVIKAYVDANSGAITSVNSKTGAVVLNASDVGALPIIGGTATGKIIVAANTAAGFESVRTISSGQERRAGFFVNSDGTSKFVNKNGGIDTASLIFDDTGVYYALGDSGSKATGKLMATQEYVDENIPEIPTKTSDLTNDSNFVTTSDIPTKTSQLTNNSGFITNAVSNLTNYYNKTEVDAKVSSVYRYIGSLPADYEDGTSTLNSDGTLNLDEESWMDGGEAAWQTGDVLNIPFSFTTGSDFVEDAGKTYAAGTNIACIRNGTTIRWDVLGGSMQVDLTDYATNNSVDTKIANAITSALGGNY